MLKIGLTGGIGSGKSTVAGIFRLLGIPIYDADLEARSLMETDPHLKSGLIKAFGDKTFLESGKLDRAFLASQVFNNQSLLKKLNALVHPAVHQDFQRWALEQNAPYVIDEAALIFESGGNSKLDQVILVTAPVEIRIQRVMKRNQTSRQEVLSRMDKQWTDDQKIPLSDFIINNDGNHSLIKQVLEFHSTCSVSTQQNRS